ncbi:glycosyltransferase family 2 protein [Pseudonocardia sp. H11422]|uniref:glycosyltransferase family 2 protein n=1 Tax=Pseudonocardia sp. H11422 TaxID=2835866 RepID=UPI001BDC4A2C|nr:glycosyltransferase family 2 protein [Pseudonocardia sp. H11422]
MNATTGVGAANVTERPTVGFVVATLDEEAAIEVCVRSLLDQRYPADKIEVVVVDGGSTDRTREVVCALAAADGRVRLLHNPARIAASAFNIGVAGTTADLVSLVSAHSTTDPDYAALLVDAFGSSGAALVGGRMDAEALPGAGPIAEAISRATSSPFGLGSARFHYSDAPGWVDTAFPGAYRRELFAQIGGFDEALGRNQDDELHLRARLAGHRMWFDPRLRSSYRPRRTLRALWHQYFQYGWWRAVTIHKHRRVASLRHLAPAALVAGLASGPVLVAMAGRRRLIAGTWAGGIASWAGVLALAGWRERGAPPGVPGRVPAAVGCLHLAYGAGFWAGAARAAMDHTRRRRGTDG